MARFEIGEHDFLLDREPFRVLSGALHYFRVHPGQWADRIRSAKEMGLNTIETYVAWNEHAPKRGQFDLDGRLDLTRFLSLVAAEGMYAIVRPGPYICAEWDNGGFPGWLTKECGTELRLDEPRYMRAVIEYFAQLLPVLEPLQIDRGGPIILVQIENEYGAYGSDKAYLRRLVDLTRAGGITVPLTTIDQPTDQMLTDGGLPELHKTASFGSRATDRLATLRTHQPTGPMMCAEFWDGWFDHWGGVHNTTSAAGAAAELDAILAAGASVNIYMFHGGTNFGLTSGANHKGRYEPTTTSYDYDAPLSESGQRTAKYFAFRDVIAKYAPVPSLESEQGTTRAPVFTAPFCRHVRVFDILDRGAPVVSRTQHDPPSMDDLGAFRGFARYSTVTSGGGILEFTEVRDRAQIYFDGMAVGVLLREHNETTIHLPRALNEGARLDVLVEDMGRVNYGSRIGESKGLIGPVTLMGQALNGWSVELIDVQGALPQEFEEALNDPAVMPSTGGKPLLSSATFNLGEPADLHFSTKSLGKGVVWVNGFNVGRYWSRGPQQTIYVPGSVTLAGANELVILETNGVPHPEACFVDGPAWSPLEK
ncbi:glycoside hydrolase family 35 protein [Leifsonia flava]|uniref:Beta-galactosidase n=1 Tax=Orlajensenia leifsoniae TaxID=2561933 RepID=A0A4Y9R8C3_9MICO|nr:beta-galactosidase family protein [Leifsonia flava]TFV99913.1 beta-galactosidase [Leifsonia flava]